jgi:flagellar protein FliO/FliZ|tara:strand:- start:14769 stop:15194 length:426 start_codon:yes stop_codon:yes gene_type:complete
MLKLTSFILMAMPSMLLASEPVTVGSQSVDPLSTANLTQWSVGLMFVLLVIVIVAWLAKRLTGFGLGQVGALKVVSGISLGTREKAVLIRAGKQYLLLGVAPGRVVKLHTFDEGEINESDSRPSGSFQQNLQSMMSKKGAE